jgi:hypothetical protein
LDTSISLIQQFASADSLTNFLSFLPISLSDLKERNSWINVKVSCKLLKHIFLVWSYGKPNHLFSNQLQLSRFIRLPAEDFLSVLNAERTVLLWLSSCIYWLKMSISCQSPSLVLNFKISLLQINIKLNHPSLLASCWSTRLYLKLLLQLTKPKSLAFGSFALYSTILLISLSILCLVTAFMLWFSYGSYILERLNFYWNDFWPKK